VEHLALALEVPNDARNILDRNGRIDAMLIKQVNPVRAQASERAFDPLPDQPRIASNAWSGAPRLKIDVEAKLCRDDDVVPEALRRLSQNTFAFVRSVNLGRVEEADAVVIGRFGMMPWNVRLMFCTPMPIADTSSVPSLRWP
jgi:hypothetical protein